MSGPDKIIIEGVGGGLDGEYDCDIIALLAPGHAEYLTYREGHRIKKLTDLRPGEYDNALAAGDEDMTIGLAVVILERHGKTVNDSLLWDAPMHAKIKAVIATRETPAEDADPLDGESSSESSTTSGTDGETDTASRTTSPENESGTSDSDTSDAPQLRSVI